MDENRTVRVPVVERVSNAIIREVKKWDGITNHGELMQVVCMFSRPLAKRLIRIVRESKEAK